MKKDIQKITVSSQEFINWLAAGHPIQLTIYGEDWGHVIAVVGYDSVKKTFTYVNSSGDRWDKNGFGEFTFSEVDNKKCKFANMGDAWIIDIVPPRPVPAARIRVTTPEGGGRRMNVNLWLSVEGSPLPRRKIWPHGDGPIVAGTCIILLGCLVSSSGHRPRTIVWCLISMIREHFRKLEAP